eukprot:3263229-Ditylum_brightwellii.AAC.1
MSPIAKEKEEDELEQGSSHMVHQDALVASSSPEVEEEFHYMDLDYTFSIYDNKEKAKQNYQKKDDEEDEDEDEEEDDKMMMMKKKKMIR